MIEINDKIHLIIFCEAKYRRFFLDSCILSIKNNIKDRIASKTIISNDIFEYPEFDVIHDDEIWQIIDPESKFKNSTIYKRRWLKQQILKLSCDKIKCDNILIVDVDLFFLKPISLLENKKFNFYMSEEYEKDYFKTNRHLLDLDKHAKNSFISDFMLFNAKILSEIRTHIEMNFDCCWLEAINSYMENLDLFGQKISEYELYGNYLLKHHPYLINKMIDPVDYKMWIYLGKHFNRKNAKDLMNNPENFLEFVKSKSNNYYQSIFFR